uniref:Uncharacterized protein n=1 Tax=Magallana gigas TaxID=29159 RepID=A0A8W8IW26_MAGGI
MNIFAGTPFLSEDQKVVVDDDNGTFAKRSSYLKLIQKKFPEKTIALVSVQPKYGQSQVLWNQEVCLNEEDVTVSYADITSWFDPKTGKVAYNSNEEPDEEEGYKLFHHEAHLENFSAFKFDIPGLLIQIESIYTKSDNGLSLRHGIKDICVHWNEQNPIGRIIFIQFGNREPLDEIRLLLTKLAKQLDFPFYLFHISVQTAATPYSEPPNPGILAFLQKRHCLFLHCTKTLYIYQTQNHMKMAQAAGVNCVKITQVLHNTALVNGSHVITRSPVPDFLRTMEILPKSQTPSRIPSLPCVTQDRDWLNSYMRCELPQGRQEFIFAQDIDTVLSYQELYQSCVTKLTKPECIYTQSRGGEEEPKVDNNTSLNSSTRKLPSWMLGKEEATPTKLSLDRTDSSSSTDGLGRQTFYIMNEEELLEVAKDILKQAGKNTVLRYVCAESDIDNKTWNKNGQNKTEPKSYKHQNLNVKGKSAIEEQESDKPGPSGWKPRRGSGLKPIDKSELDRPQQRRRGAGSKCALLDDLMGETGVRKASPCKTRYQPKNKEEEKKSHMSSSASNFKPTSKRGVKKTLDFLEKGDDQSTSIGLKTMSGASKETALRDLSEICVRGSSEEILPDSLEPYPSDLFPSTRVSSNETRRRPVGFKDSEKSPRIVNPQVKDSKKRTSDSDERQTRKVRNTGVKSEQIPSNKPDLSVLDEIFF